MGQDKQRPMLLTQLQQRLCLLQRGRHWFVADHMNPCLQKSPGYREMQMIRRDYGDGLNAIFTLAFLPGHHLKITVDACLLQPQCKAGGQRTLRC